MKEIRPKVLFITPLEEGEEAEEAMNGLAAIKVKVKDCPYVLPVPGKSCFILRMRLTEKKRLKKKRTILERGIEAKKRMERGIC